MSDLETPAAPHCARHPEAPAEHVCSRCGDQICAACWSEPAELCDLCAERDPLFHVLPLPWEREQPLSRRVFGTIWDLLRPWSRAAALARGSVRAAAQFALLTAVPLSCVATIIPMTRTLLFGESFSIEHIGNPSDTDVAWDVVRAMALGPVSLLLFLVPHALGLLLGSLFRAPKVWLRYVLYWAWLHPLALLFTYGVGWALGESASVVRSAVQLPVVVVFWASQFFVARRACDTSPPLTVLAGVLGMLGWLFGFVFFGMWLVLTSPFVG